MHINSDALRFASLNISDLKHLADTPFSSLQVFDPEDHASLHSDKSKEGLSIYGALEPVILGPLNDPNVGVLDNTRTTLGRNLLREWLLRPSLSLPVIAARHAAVACFIDPENMTTADDIQKHLSGIKNSPRILKMLKSGKAKVKDWQGVVEVRTRSCHSMCPFTQRNDLPDSVCLSRRHDPRLAGGVGTRKPRRFAKEGRGWFPHRGITTMTLQS